MTTDSKGGSAGVLPARLPIFDAYDAVLARGADPSHASRVATLRAAFEERTGAFRPEDPWFEARSRAFWDDAVTRGGFTREVAVELDEGARDWVPAFARAHRGLFVVRGGSRDLPVLRDLWGGAEFVVHAIDAAMSDALAAAAAPFDARLVGRDEPARVALLPGAVFHPADAAAPITEVLAAARARGLGTHDALDALLRMERGLRASSRVKAAYAYRAKNLDRLAIDGPGPVRK
jgi:hypothetical protein